MSDIEALTLALQEASDKRWRYHGTTDEAKLNIEWCLAQGRLDAAKALARAAQEAQDKLAQKQEEAVAEAARLAEEKRQAEQWAAVPDSTKIEMLFGHVAALMKAHNEQAETINALVRKTNRLADPGAASAEIKPPPPFACHGIIQP